MGVTLAPPARRRLTILCIGAHPDDIEIGCGGTILTLLRARPRTRVHWVLFSAAGRRAEEARLSASRFLKAAGRAEVHLHEFRDGFFPHEGAAIKESLEVFKSVEPDLVFTHYAGDRHQDHRLLSEMTWSTFREHLILEYEIPKYDADLGTPNLFVPVSRSDRRKKVAILMESFASQRRRPWFTPTTFEAVMRLRGIECRAPQGYAEGFYTRKLMLQL